MSPGFLHIGSSLVVGNGLNVQDALGTVIYVSPWYDRSEDWYGRCLKFKYKFSGSGARALWIYQKLDYYFDKIPIWVANDKSNTSWRYGQVSITTVSRYQVC